MAFTSDDHTTMNNAFIWPTAQTYGDSVYSGLFKDEGSLEERARNSSEPHSETFLTQVSRSLVDDLNHYLLEGDLQHPSEEKFRKRHIGSTRLTFATGAVSGLLTLFTVRQRFFRLTLLLGSAFMMGHSRFMSNNPAASFHSRSLPVFHYKYFWAQEHFPDTQWYKMVHARIGREVESLANRFANLNADAPASEDFAQKGQPAETDTFSTIQHEEQIQEPQPARVRFRDSLSPMPVKRVETVDSDMGMDTNSPHMDGPDPAESLHDKYADSNDVAVQRTLQSSAWARLRRQHSSE